MTTQLIDLPAAPLAVTTADEILSNAKVGAWLTDDEYSEGHLLFLSIGEGQLGMREQETWEGIQVPLDKLRYLQFQLPVPPSTEDEDDELAGLDSEGIEIDKPFRVEFNDGNVIEGTTRTHQIDSAGLHLFRLTEDDAIHRLYIPHTSIARHQVGPLLGDALIETQQLDAETLRDAIDSQTKSRDKRLGEYLQETAVVSDKDLHKFLDQTGRKTLDGRTVKIGETLIKEGVVTESQLERALNAQKADRSKKIGQILVDHDVISADQLKLTLARKLGIPAINLRKYDVQPEALVLMPVSICQKHNVFPIALHHDRLVVATDDPTNSETNDIVRFISGHHIEFVICTRDDIDWAIEKYYEVSLDIEKNFTDAERDQADKITDEEREFLENEKLSNEQPIVKLVNEVLLDSVRRRASDVIIRPLSERVQLLFRIDGVLTEIRNFSRLLLPAIAARIKIMGKMDMTERKLPQDGRIHMPELGKNIDFRVSAMPTVKGESIVIRVLNATAAVESIDNLGIEEADEKLFRHMLRRNNGVILVTGPTGSGKTTTLYGALNELIGRNLEIISVEDPVEYQIDEVEQIQINPGIGYTFSKALKHILRHNPDVIMVGEIRDRETASIALESSLTGHLVLSTLHTKNACGAVTRFIDMGIEPYVLSSTLLGVMAQRLVRRNCEHCLKEEPVDESLRTELGIDADEVFYRGSGCSECNDSGYHGRLMTYELLNVDEGIREAMLSESPTALLHQRAREGGMVPLTQHALELARRKQTSLAEVYRIRLE